MDSSPRKKVRIDDKVTEIKSKNYQQILREEPLIPSEIVDEAFQRIFIISLFILLQSWKIYDLIGLNVGSEVAVGKFSFVFKYAMVEGIFFWFLPILNVSYLMFSPIMTLLITIIFNIINILIVNKLNVSLVVTVVAPLVQNLQNQKELTLSGEKINPNIDIDSHFSGKYTIHYLPDSLAKFNVFGLENVCQGLDKEPFQIPIQFNTTTDVAFLEIEHTSPLSTVSYHQYGESQINKLMKRDYSHLKSNKNFVKDDDRVFYIEIPVKEPGSYKIKKIRDRRGSSMRFVQNEFSFATCPQGQFSVPKSVSNNFNNKICVGKVADDTTMKLPLLMLEGSPPMTAKILASFKGKKVKVIESTINEDDSTLNVTNYFSHKLTRNLLEQEVIKDPSILKVSESGSLEFQLLEVKDSLGNVKKYNPQADTPDLRYALDLLTKPSLRLIDMESSRPLLVNGTKGLSFAASKNIVEQFPITARFNFEDPIDSLRSYNFTHVFKDLNDLRSGVQVANPGHYKLLSVLGNYCDCEVQDSIITFETVNPPTLSVDAKPVMDKCVGMTGYNFKFEAEGKPPFAVEYSVYSNHSGSLRPLIGPQGRSIQVLRSDKPQFEFDYKPPGEGSFVIIFKTIRDAFYKSPILLDESQHTYSTYFKQRSRVSFFDKQGSIRKVLRSCQGESNSVPVHFNGHFPFKFDYSIVDSTGKAIISKVGQAAQDKLFEINTEGISGGTYDVVISNVADGIGCSVDYNVAEKVQIITRSDTPEISFDTSSDIVKHKIVEGDHIDIPLKVISSVGRTQSDKIEYEVTENGHTSRGVINGMNSLRIRTPGVYKLSTFVNGGCRGKISSEKAIHVSFYDRPSLSVNVSPDLIDPSSVTGNIILKSGCQGCKRDISLDLKGKGPFVIDYEIKFPSGKSDLRTMTVAGNTLDIKLSTSQGGIYQHVFKGIYDQLYTKERGRSRVTLPSVSYSVHESPLVEFSKASTVLLCEASLGGRVTELSKLPIALRGQPPFKIDLSISGEKMKPRSFSLEDISSPTLDLNNVLDSKGEYIWKNLKQGEYVVKIDKVQDVNECVGKEFSHFNQLVISVTPAPDISPLQSKKHFCVGDHVGYDLVGAAPFNLHYTFNNNTYNSQTEPEFRRLAAKPGVIQVTGIEDSSAGRCLIDIDANSQRARDLELTIHDLPSVEINQGDSVIQDIHEGDLTEMKFTFTGTPPFTVTYVRTLDPSSTAKRSKNSKYQKSREKITETTTIKDIWEYDYSVNVGLEGTYEAIEIRDAYCVAKKDFN
ncbi:nucleoporin Pom152p [[Candida] jaroonii]|uniref:Nucleoporin Pom152p n=1 Tax=[Candida] jaroonii TaxID=467808 RepID=A0ACA9Y1L1_9ASCO|nr:nucleoporin Pom152p [[Candida] jaroonii]